MDIAIVGTGYVGLVTGTCFADSGHNVYCIDIDEEKIRKLQTGIVPIYEPGLSEMIIKNVNNDRLHFSTRLQDIINRVDVCFIAVGTPMSADGSANLSFVYDVAETIGQYLDKAMIVVDKSTVPIGTSDEVSKIIQLQLSQRNVSYDFEVVSNPEFLKEGTAVNDFYYPDRVIIGATKPSSINKMVSLYSTFVPTEKIIIMDQHSAEMTKYVANSMLATKISFINEMSLICEFVGADILKVVEGISTDRRIGPHFLNAGCGYGGSCFPKDVSALISICEKNGFDPIILKSVSNRNDCQKNLLFEKMLKIYGNNIDGKRIAIWGLAFKPDTDDMRESPAINLVNLLTKQNCSIVINDPQSMNVAKNYYFAKYNNIQYSSDIYGMLSDADCLVIVTDWDIYKNADFNKVSDVLKGDYIFDGRNIIPDDIMKNIDKKIIQIGRNHYD